MFLSFPAAKIWWQYSGQICFFNATLWTRFFKTFVSGVSSAFAKQWFLTRAFNLPTRTFNLPTRAFNLATRAFNLATRAFSLLTRGFELVTRGFEFVTRELELVTREFELVTLGFELVTRVLLFHVGLLLSFSIFR